MRGSLPVLAVLALLTASVSPAAAETELQEYLEAGKTFESLKAEALKTGDVPRPSDPRVRDTLAILANNSRTFGSASFRFDDDAAKSDLCSVAVRATMTYGLFGLEAFVKEKGLSPTSGREAFYEATLELQGRNVVSFQDEVFPLLAFSVRCLAASLPWLAGFVEKLPSEQMTEVRREGLRKVRQGVREVVIGDIESLNHEGLREGNRRLLFSPSRAIYPVFPSHSFSKTVRNCEPRSRSWAEPLPRNINPRSLRC